MKKYILKEHQMDSLLYGMMAERELLTEGKFAETLKGIASQYYPSFLEKITDEELEIIDKAFVAKQTTSGEARKWIIGMVIKGYLPSLLANVDGYASAVNRFLGNKALIAQNENNPELYTGNNENNLVLNYVDLDDIRNAADPKPVAMLKRAAEEEGTVELAYEDAEIAVFHILSTGPIQRAAHEIINGWCTKHESNCMSYTSAGHLWNILYKLGGHNPFSGDVAISNNLQLAGDIQININKRLDDNYGTTKRGEYGVPVEIRNRVNVEITLKRVFERYNKKLLTVMARGILDYVKVHGMLFWYDYTQNTDVNRQFPEWFIKLIDDENKKNLEQEIKEALSLNGTLIETGLMMYKFTADDGQKYSISINAAMNKSKAQTEYDPKDNFKRVVKRRFKDPIVTYNGIELLDLNKPATFTKYVDIRQMAAKQPYFSALANGKIDPAMFGNLMFNHYKQRFPGSSNVEIFNSYFVPYLNIDALYHDYIASQGPTSAPRKVTINVPMFKHELTALLLRPLEEIESMPTMISLEVNVTPLSNTEDK